MKAKEVWVIVPFSRPSCFENVVSNFTRQTFQNKKLVLVENGDAIGCCKERGFEPDLLLTSERHQAIAKNVGLAALRERKAEFWTTYDDDDWYNNSYLDELIDCSDKAEMVGKHNIFVKTTDDRLWLLQDSKENSFVDAVHGPTISAWVKDTVVDFPNTGQWGEDLAFINDMQLKGAKLWSSSRWNFIFQRHKNHNHTWHTTDYQLSQCWHYSHYSNKDSKITEYNVSVSDARKIVAQQMPLPSGTEVEMQEYKDEDSPAVCYVREKAGDMDDWVQKQLKDMGMKP